MDQGTKSREDQKKIIIIGGGITGLSAGWYIQKRTKSKINLSLIEPAPFLGGKMITRKLVIKDDQFIIDAGPESFVTRKPEAWQLALDLGLKERIVNPGSETKDMYVLDGGKPKKIPLSPPAFLRSDLLTLKGKLRMGLEPLIPAKRDWDDESLADFVRRRLGEEALEKMIGPVLAGIYNTDPETQSILTTSPIMREMERDHGGLFRGAFARMRARRTPSQGERPPQFMAFDQGAQVLVDELAAALDVEIFTGKKAEGISREGERYRVTLEDGASLEADAIVITTTANQASSILEELDRRAADLLAEIQHENIGTATMIYKQGQISLPYKVNGLMIPRRENRQVDAVTWTSNKPMDRSPAGYEMLRVFIGGSNPSLVTKDKREILAEIQAELASMLGILADPLASEIFCWPDSFPQAHVGHLQLVDRIEEALPAGIYVAGSSYRGIGVPDCIRQAKVVADQLCDFIL